MTHRVLHLVASIGCLIAAAPMPAQTPADPFPTPIPVSDGVIRVGFKEFATVPDVNGMAPRVMVMVDEPGTRRFFVNAQTGGLFTVGYNGGQATLYLDLNDPRYGFTVMSRSREQGFQAFAFHPQFAQAGTPGYGKFYTLVDTPDTNHTPDFRPNGPAHLVDNVLLEWTTKTPGAATYDGGPPRELMRFADPFANHNGGMIAFNPLARSGQADFGLLYIGVADGGSGGDPYNQAQNLAFGFGKVFRIDPLGKNSTNGKYGIPASNPFAGDNNPATLGEIFAYGVRNPQHFTWDPQNGRMFLADIGQNVVEELDTLSAGSNLGWHIWEGSYTYGQRGVGLDNPRGDPKVSFPIAEFDQTDALFPGGNQAVTGLVVYRGDAVPALKNTVLWGDLPSGEMFYVSADKLPGGGQDPIHRVLFNDGGSAKTFLEVIRAKNAQQGKSPAGRADLRITSGPNGQIFLLDKGDGVIRVLAP